VSAVRCPHCLHVWDAPPADGPLACPVCGGAVVPTPARAVEAGFSLPLPSGAAPPPFLAPPQAPDELGRLGRYRVLRELGAGGMGAVYEAEDTQLLRRVALKVMHPEAAAQADGKARFLREARAAAALTHDHIVPIHDVGEQGGVAFLVMPLLRGESLEGRLKRQRPLPLPEALRVAREMAEGLAAAHEAGLVHRDVKPANVWLEAPAGRVKLLDFGLARPVEGDAVRTPSGAVLGTPAYMAPEQAAGGKDVDFRADLFGLGAVLYELLTGRRAFPGANFVAVMANRLKGPPPAPQEVNAAVPADISGLVMRLLAEEPSQRPASAGQVAEELGSLAGPPLAAPRQAPQGPAPAPQAGVRHWVTDPSFVNAVGMKMIRVQRGTFYMGSTSDDKDALGDERPQHPVKISRDFFLAECKVTQEEYRRVVGRAPSYFSAAGGGKEKVRGLSTDRFPVESVSWHEAVEFCRLLSELPEEKRAGRVYRLPTEAEWEHACRAGTTTRFHFGDDPDGSQIGDYAWYEGNSGDRTRPVREKRPNPWGLYGMGGLVGEWCSDGKRTYEGDWGWFVVGCVVWFFAWVGLAALVTSAGARLGWSEQTVAGSVVASLPGSMVVVMLLVFLAAWLARERDPVGPQGDVRVLRGGSWSAGARHCRSASRWDEEHVEGRFNNVGFRVACSLPS
jgi:formylglycine-generating enzyme required for sulfatase activity